MEMSAVIKAIRLQIGISQEAFADAIHVAFSTVNRWENKKSTPNRMARTLIVDYCEKNGIDKSLIVMIENKNQ